MKRYELVVIGAGPAGLSAAIAAASQGMETIVFDENALAGGQLFKQIHKFFGSKEHRAKIRGANIGRELVEEAHNKGAKIVQDAVVMGIYPHGEININQNDQIFRCKADNIIIAAGASENAIAFPGWTLPGVMGAGAAQTMMNLHGVMPGNRVLMVGSGNVGLVVSFQLLQAGCKVEAVIDAADSIGGYGVHSSKVTRTGVPFYLNHTIIRAEGEGRVERAVIAQVDDCWNVIQGTEKELEVDTICLAVGLSPMFQLAGTAGCELRDEPLEGGMHPIINEYGETSISGIFAAGDVVGIEEASSAMISGQIAGISAALRGGYISEEKYKEQHSSLRKSLGSLRKGMFGSDKANISRTKTSEGIELSKSLLKKGYIALNELQAFSGFTKDIKGVHPVVECTQNIPCNPCQDVCIQECILIKDNDINNLPIVQEGKGCTACGLCVSACPGQAIFLINEDYSPDFATVSIPYELWPLPEKGDKGTALDRSGKQVCTAEVIEVRKPKVFDQTAILIMKIPIEKVNEARFFVKEAV